MRGRETWRPGFTHTQLHNQRKPLSFILRSRCETLDRQATSNSRTGECSWGLTAVSAPVQLHEKTTQAFYSAWREKPNTAEFGWGSLKKKQIPSSCRTNEGQAWLSVPCSQRLSSNSEKTLITGNCRWDCSSWSSTYYLLAISASPNNKRYLG